METEGQRRLALYKTTPPREQDGVLALGLRGAGERGAGGERVSGEGKILSPAAASEQVVLLKRAGRICRTAKKSSGRFWIEKNRCGASIKYAWGLVI